MARPGPAAPRGVARTFSIRRDAALSLHVQLVEQLKHHIEERTWGPGAQLPAAQHLAGSLGINPNTVRAVIASGLCAPGGAHQGGVGEVALDRLDEVREVRTHSALRRAWVASGDRAQDAPVVGERGP